jgi:hypothetical protein
VASAVSCGTASKTLTRYVIVYDDAGHFAVLPLLTMTGLKSKVSEAGPKQK